MQEEKRRAVKRTESLELYLHIPFCVRKCLYCDFLSFPAPEEIRSAYVEKLTEEIRACGKRPELLNRAVTTVFLGGGTPSLLKPEETEQLLGTIRDSFRLEADAEITMEANPGAFDGIRAKRWRKAGINRLSLGLQTVCAAELERLGRIHTAGDFLESFCLAREAGFDNLNVDLMSGLPGQTMESLQRTLEYVAGLNPEHISAYSLIIEEGTPFYDTYGAMEADLERYGEWSEIPPGHRSRYEGVLPLPGEETERKLYHAAEEFLKGQGYERYEISNYARAGRECRHNTGYWTGADYLGLGLGAASLLDGARFTVTRSMEEYLSMTRKELLAGGQYRERRLLTVQEKMEEFMFLGLRLIRGVRTGDFFSRFGRSLESVYGEACAGLLKDGLLIMSGEGSDRSLRLSGRGLDISNYVLAKFLL